MVFRLNHIASGSPSASTATTSAPSTTSSTLELGLVGHCPVGGDMRHQQLVARNLGICVEKGDFALVGKSQMLPMVQNWVPGGHYFT